MAQYKAGVTSAQIKLDVCLSVVKPQMPVWLLAACNHYKNNAEMLVKGWRHAGLLDAWEPAVQQAAWQRVAELFPNMQLGNTPTPSLRRGE